MTTDRKIEVGLAAISFPLMALGLAFNSEALMLGGSSAILSIVVWEGIKFVLRNSKFVNPTQPDQ